MAGLSLRKGEAFAHPGVAQSRAAILPHQNRTWWRGYTSQLALERLGVPSDKLKDVAREREVWSSLLRLLPL